MSLQLANLVGGPTEGFEGAGRGILVVEDSEHVRDFLVWMLTALDYTVFAASCHQDAVALFEREQDKVDMVFCDAIVPNETRPELAEELLARKEGLCVLLGTGTPELGAQLIERGSGRCTLLQRPYGVRELLGAIREALGRG